MPNLNLLPPLVLVDCRPETEEVLKAVFEPRGVSVSRLLHERGAQPATCIIIRGQTTGPRATHVQLINEQPVAEDSATRRELTLPPLFHYGDLIRKVERLLNEVPAA